MTHITEEKLRWALYCEALRSRLILPSRLRLLFLLCAAVVALAEEPLPPVKVPYRNGSFDFDNMRVEDSGMSGTVVRGDIINKTGTNWPVIEFRLAVSGFSYKGAWAGPKSTAHGGPTWILLPDRSSPVRYEVALRYEGLAGESNSFTRPLGDLRHLNAPAFALIAVDVVVVNGVSTEDAAKAREEKETREETARKQVLEKEAAARSAATAEQAARLRAAQQAAERRRRELSQYPRLANGKESVPIGADEKCLDEAVNVINDGGLEARKKLPELVGYKCIFIVDRDTPVRIDKKGWRRSVITVMDGEHQGQSGWVLSEWVR